MPHSDQLQSVWCELIQIFFSITTLYKQLQAISVFISLKQLVRYLWLTACFKKIVTVKLFCVPVHQPHKSSSDSCSLSGCRKYMVFHLPVSESNPVSLEFIMNRSERGGNDLWGRQSWGDPRWPAPIPSQTRLCLNSWLRECQLFSPRPDGATFDLMLQHEGINGGTRQSKYTKREEIPSAYQVPV